MESTEVKKFERVVQRIAPHSKLLRAWELKGGVSARVTALELERPDGQTRKMIVRRHGDADLKQNPHLAADEFRLLRVLQSVGLAAPVPYHLDQSCEIFPTPYVVMEYIEGETEFAPSSLSNFIHHLAGYLSRVHSMDGSSAELSFLPEQSRIYAEKLANRPEELDESLQEGRIREVLELVWSLPRRNRPVLLHGDFWPGNLLWKGGRLVAVIDWEDAALGDPLADLANSRLEILWAFGVEAMHRFTDDYKSMTSIDFTDLPYWDLCAALRPVSRISEWSLDGATEEAMREGHRLFVGQAFEEISVLEKQ